MKIDQIDNKEFKLVRSKNYNYNFNKKSGFFMRWGKTTEDDPDFAPFPEILDIEISTICSQNCAFCYKSNIYKGKNMTFDTFKVILDKMPFLTQIAIGVGDVNANPDLCKIIEYTRQKDIIPNMTINGYNLTEELADFFNKNLGAISVSCYDKEITYNTIELLLKKGLKQVNLHQILAKETIDKVKERFNDFKKDQRLLGLNSILLLSLKKKGRGLNGFNSVNQEEFTELIKLGLSEDIPLAFDSCSAVKFLKAIEGHKKEKELQMMTETCESGRMSAYINVEGEFFPCSFIEGEILKYDDWTKGLDVLNSKFTKDIWNNEKTLRFRNKNLECFRNNISCSHYNI